MSPVLARRCRTALLWTAAVAVVALYGFPFVYLVLTSFKPATDAIAVPPTVLPQRFSLDNYLTALNGRG
ncbi:hypothetical protein [Micromonospora sp. 4G55]|uniref:hypothetical protein n=1 Tax=Micromonospora sp. 4G55 TaxID=2806102 RepID=UPI001A4C1DB6|nr:hypothetical protein [Micromonospora sp. 4G55]MBM0259745.1 hypothetical protein [Micromonospora sp. 4G55]